MEKILDKLTGFYIKKNIISEDEKDIYCYGFKLIVADVINFSLILFIGTIINLFKESVVYLLTLALIRRHSGGFHAKSFTACRVAMIVTFLMVATVYMIITKFGYGNNILLLLNVFNVLYIAIYSPVKHPNKELNEKEKKNNKLKAIVYSVIFACISTLLISFKINAGVIILLTMSAIVILMLAAQVSLKGGKNNV